MQEVQVCPVPLEWLAGILSSDRAAVLSASAARARDSFGDRVVWHVNATAHGGGVAEMLQTLLAYGKGAGIENRWLVIDGDPEFFVVTKRVHNMLHGAAGDGGPLGETERAHYAATLDANLQDMLLRPSRGDIVLLHDPRRPDSPRVYGRPACTSRDGATWDATSRTSSPTRRGRSCGRSSSQCKRWCSPAAPTPRMGRPLTACGHRPVH